MRHAYNPERQFTVYNNHLPVLRVTIHLQSVGPFSLDWSLKENRICVGGPNCSPDDANLCKNNQIYSGKSPRKQRAIYAKRPKND